MAYSPTAFQLTHLLQKVWPKISQASISLATGGSTTTLIDTKLVDALGDGNEDNFFLGGTIIVIKDAGGTGAAPEGECSRITAYDSTSSAPTFTFSPAMTIAIAAGDKVMYISPDIPLYDMLEIVDTALVSLGRIPVFDSSSIVAASSETEYTLPVAMEQGDILDVMFPTYNTSGNYEWRSVPFEQKAATATGTTGFVVFEQPVVGYPIGVTYLGTHPRVEAYSDYIKIPQALAIPLVLVHAWDWLEVQQGGLSDDQVKNRNKVVNNLAMAETKHKIHLPQRKSRGMPHWYSSDLTPETDPLNTGYRR